MGNDVAPGPKPNTIRPVRIGFCLLEVAPPPVPPKDVEKEPAAEAKKEPTEDSIYTRDEYLKGLKVTPLAEAFVVILPKGGSPKSAIYAKTTQRGEPMRIDKNALDAPPPEDKAHWVFLDDGVTYECFWSWDKALFATAIKDAGVQASTTLRAYGFFEFTTRQVRIDAGVLDGFFPTWGGPGSPDSLTHNRVKLAGLLHNVGPRSDGYFRHRTIADMNASGAGDWLRVSSALFHGPLAIDCWVFARRPAICTIYLAEFVTHYVARVRTNSAWHFDQLHSVLAVVDAGKRGERLEELDAPLFGAPQTNKHPAFPGIPPDNALAYWQYAHDCGRAKANGKYVDGGTFENTLYNFLTYGRPPNSLWFEAAKKIKDSYGIAHPSRGIPDNDDFKAVPPEPKKSVVAYFDFYQYAAQQDDSGTSHYHNGWMTKVPAAQGRIQQIVEELSGDLRVFFRAHGDCLRTWADIGWHVKIDGDKRGMNMRFLEAAEDVGYDWWEGYPVPAAKGGQKKPKPVAGSSEDGPDPEGEEADEPEGVEPPDEVKVLMPVILAGWVTGAKQAELFEHFFAWRGRTMAARISDGLEYFKSLNRRIKCIETHLVKGKGLQPIRRGDITLEPHLNLRNVKGNVPKKSRWEVVDPKGTIVVKKGGEVVGEFDIRVTDFKGKRSHPGDQQIDVVDEAAHGHGHGHAHGGAAGEEGGLETLEVNWGKFPKGFKKLSGGKDVMKVPFWFSAMGYAFLIGYELTELWHQFKEHEVDGALVTELGVNLGLEVWTVGEAMELTFLKVAEHKGWHKTVSFIEGWGKFGKLAMGGAVAVEAILVAREGALILIDERPLADDMGKNTRATLLTVKGCVLIGGAAGAVAAMVFVSVATGGLVLAAVAIGSAVIDVAAWIWGERETAMDETDEKLVKALAREFGKDYAPKTATMQYVVCRTYDHLAELSRDLERMAASLGDMDRLADERRRAHKHESEQAAAQQGAGP
jgi:hypothetical protein